MSRYPRIAADVDDEEEAALRAMVPDGMDGDYLMAEVAPSAREGSALTMPPPGRETSVSTAAGQMLPSGAATATALCRACLARGNKWTHTCRKRRNTPAVVSTMDTPRASRQRSSATMLLPSPPLARLPLPPLVPDEAQTVSSQVVAHDAQVFGSCAMMTSAVAGGQTNTDGRAPSADIAAVALHSSDGACVIGGVHDGNAPNAGHACVLPDRNHANRTNAPCAVDLDVSFPSSDQVREAALRRLKPRTSLGGGGHALCQCTLRSTLHINLALANLACMFGLTFVPRARCM
tara:strand:+ start:205 stop:1077 length:873 start_codon:yes stop_codon:yes gene_type:complete